MVHHFFLDRLIPTVTLSNTSDVTSCNSSRRASNLQANMAKQRKSNKPAKSANATRALNSLSSLESDVMQVVWELGSAKAEEIRLELESSHDLKDSTIRTLLRRLEKKGVLEHSVEGRAFVYRPKVQADSFAAKAVRGIADRFCRGSIASLLMGMAGDEMVSADELRALADKIEQSQHKTSEKKSRKRNPQRKRKKNS